VVETKEGIITDRPRAPILLRHDAQMVEAELGLAKDKACQQYSPLAFVDHVHKFLAKKWDM
jgi:hypothetical protein